MLEEATRLRSALKEAQHRRAVKKYNPVQVETEVYVSPEMMMFEEAQAQLQKNTNRLEALRKQVEMESQSAEAEHAQLAFLDMAEKEMERTRQRMEELEMETPSEVADESPSPAPMSKTATDSSLPESQHSDGDVDHDEEGSLPALPTSTTALIATPSDMGIKPLDIASVQKSLENPRQLHERSVSMDQRDEQTWNNMMQEAPPTPAHHKQPSNDSSEFARPKALKKEEVTFDSIRKEMQLTSSPLVFFNLACFQNNGDADLDVMLPICGYAVAGRMLCVMGPPGTNTAILRVALSEPPQVPGQREVHVADFTIRDLVEVSDSILRPDYLSPSVPLLQHLELEAVADVQIGTCIQRGVSDSDSSMGTPRGSRNPEAPTPRNPTTPRFRGTGAGIQKSVLLMEDLVSILDAQSIFRVLKVLRKLASAKRATVLITLSKPFERRGLFQLFDDALYFTVDGVSYFGPARRLKDYCSLIGHPCPTTSHITDHIGNITNAAAKYDESPMKVAVDQVIMDFTGKPKEPVRAEETDEKKGGIFKRKKAKKAEPEQDDSPGGQRARNLAQRLAEERRQLAMQQKASEKLDVWRRLTDLDSHIPKGKDQAVASTLNVTNFDAMILELQESSKGHRPSCFMNLACFLNFENPDRIPASVIQPTCAFANEGQLLGVMGPSGSDAANLLASLKLGGDNTMLTSLTVRDTLKLSEFVKHREQSDKLESAVELVMGKMMLTACSQEVIGTLIQRGNPQVPTTTMVGIGDQTFSTAVRSILILDRILELDAQSVFVVLKLLKRIASSARLAIVLMLDSAEAAEGLFYLLDTFLTFTEEGVGYFGAAKHLLSFCALIGFPCPESKHVTNHIQDVMIANPPSKYYAAESNTNTPFTIRYTYSALAKFNKGIIDVSTKPPSEGGAASSRTFVPKSFRSKKTSRTEELDALIERAELERQRLYRLQVLKEEEADKLRQRDKSYEEVWKRLAATDSSTKSASRKPLNAGLKSIVNEMMEYQQKPSLFFNLACFLPDDINARVDMMQPICGYAIIGRIVAIAGPPQTNLTAFLRALSGDPEPGKDDSSAPLASARSDVRTHSLTVFELLKIAESSRPDRGSQPIHETTKALMINLGLENSADCKIGSMIQRGVSGRDLAGLSQLPSILMLDRLSESLDAQSAFVVLKIVKRIAAQAHLSILVHLIKPAERRGLFSLIDDIILFDNTGVTYFGPANRLGDYLRLVGYSFGEEEHETDACFSILDRYAKEQKSRMITDTTPPVRYKYSPLSEYVNSVVTKYTRPSEKSEYDLQSHRGSADGGAAGSTFVPKNTRNIFKKKVAKISKEEERRRIEEEEAASKRDEVAAREAEAERMRVAEADAESVWRRMAEEGEEK